MKLDIDVLIPTSKTRLHNLLFQIRSAFSQGLGVRVTIAMDGEYPELMDHLASEEKKKMRFVHDAPKGLIGNPAVSYCMETLEWADWYYVTGDDDALLPWGLRHLYENRQGVSMVIGEGLCVSREKHESLAAWKIGGLIKCGRVSASCALFNFRDIEKLPRPWFNSDSKVADFELISRMATTYPYRMIPSTIFVLTLI